MKMRKQAGKQASALWIRFACALALIVGLCALVVIALPAGAMTIGAACLFTGALLGFMVAFAFGPLLHGE